MKLPESFINEMKLQLKEEWSDFYETYSKPIVRGIRVNTLKISVEAFKEICPFGIEPVPWTSDGFYIKEDARPGIHPYYYAGLYYIQEPSAMLPAMALNPNPEHITLDLCAAPGGKSMQMAAMMNNQGLLISNDISSNRLRAVIRNGELLGVKNLLVLNDHQSIIGPTLRGTVDRLLLDAPCSGEGMFKKHEDATHAYETFSIEMCQGMQEEIIDDITQVVKDNGELVYSTCTFNTYENENMINRILDGGKFKLDEINKVRGFMPGIGMEEAIRLYPHKLRGEGHFVCKLKCIDGQVKNLKKRPANTPPSLLSEFMDKYLYEPLKGHFLIKKDRVFLLPDYDLNLGSIKVVKEGWYLGDLKKNRFEPSHAFALGLRVEQVKHSINFKHDSIEIEKYLKCETISCEGSKGYNIVCVDGYPVGWCKWANGKLKNLYPAAWRK